jgi:AcrR family transcriptional regulator
MTPARILRAMARRLDPTLFTLTERQRVREARILAVAQHLIASEGRHNITFATLAVALRIGTATLRWHFVDLDALLGEIINRHLAAVAAELAKIPADAADAAAKRRAAYLAYTRTPNGDFTEPHRIMLRDRHTLPPDELDPIERTRHDLAVLLAPAQAHHAYGFLDCLSFDAGDTEAFLDSLARRAAPATTPAPMKRPESKNPIPISTHVKPAPLPADWAPPRILPTPPRVLPTAGIKQRAAP